MAEPVRDNRFLWGAVIFALLVWSYRRVHGSRAER